ncbi:hypothetical protein ACOSP7_012395 [Xanthoceras sorbifolium]
MQGHTTPDPALPSFNPPSTDLDLLHDNQTQHYSPPVRQRHPSKVIPKRTIGEDTDRARNPHSRTAPAVPQTPP